MFTKDSILLAFAELNSGCLYFFGKSSSAPSLSTLLLLNPARILDLGEPAAVVGGGWQEAVGRLSTTAAAPEQASSTEVAAGPGLLRLKQP